MEKRNQLTLLFKFVKNRVRRAAPKIFRYSNVTAKSAMNPSSSMFIIPNEH